MHLSPFAVFGVLVIRQIVKCKKKYEEVRLANGHGIEGATAGFFVLTFRFFTCNINCPYLLLIFNDCNIKLPCVRAPSGRDPRLHGKVIQSTTIFFKI